MTFPRRWPSWLTSTRKTSTHDLNAASDFLSTAGFSPASTGIVGYCMGGTVSFIAATLKGVVCAAASFYGGGIEAGRFGFPALLEIAPELAGRLDWTLRGPRQGHSE